MKCASWLALPIGLGLTTCAPPLPPSIEFTVLQANVGNAKLSCGDDYIYKLCDVDVEQRIAEQIAQLVPDVVVLQEVVPDALCDGFVEGDATKVCHPVHRAGEPSQVRRLLGDGYDIACDERNGYECIGVRTAGRVRPAFHRNHAFPDLQGWKIVRSFQDACVRLHTGVVQRLLRQGLHGHHAEWILLPFLLLHFRASDKQRPSGGPYRRHPQACFSAQVYRWSLLCR